MKNKFKRILLLVLILLTSFTLIGCDKKLKEVVDNEEFNLFLDEAFVELLGIDPLVINYMLKYPEKLGIDNSTVLPYSYTKEDDEEHFEILKNLKNRLLEFDDKELSVSQILTKKVFLDALESDISLEGFYGYKTVLDLSDGIQAMLPYQLTVYRFNTETDIDNYLDYIRCLKESFENAIAYETWRSNNNMGLTDSLIDQIIDQCDELINQEENFLIASFNEKLDEVIFLDEANKTVKKQELLSLLNNEFIEAYTYLKNALIPLKGKITHNGSASNYLKGKEFYEATLRAELGSNLSVLEIEAYFEEKLAELKAWYDENTDTYQDSVSIDLMEGLTLDSLIEFFQTKMEGLFPPLDEEIEYSILTFPEHMQGSTTSAMYFTSPIDEITTEVIYLNPTYVGEVDNTLYLTVAHEGFPGHLYQHVYLKTSNLHNVRKMFSYLAYAEGWTMYIENEIVGFIDEDAKKAFEYKNSAGPLKLCLLDIGIHYHGWSLEVATEYMNENFNLTVNTPEFIYSVILENPMMYAPYMYGYFQVQELKTSFKERLGEEYTDLAFHTALLDIGPAPFSILKEELEKYN